MKSIVFNTIRIIRQGKRAILLIIPVFVALFGSYAQDIDKDVRVVKPYEPKISDANKVELVPEEEDTATFRAQYNYEVTPVKQTTDYEVTPFKAAKMVSESITKLYKSHLKLGYGNYVTPLFELHMNSLRDKDRVVGASLTHKSSHGKVRLANDEKVFAGYADNHVGVFGTKLYRRSKIDGSISLNSNTRYFYGYNPDTILIPPFEKEDIKQRYLNPGLDFTWESTHADSNHLNYQVYVGYDYLQDLYENAEHTINFKTYLERYRRGALFGLTTEAFTYSGVIDDTTRFRTFVEAKPIFSKASKEWRFILGFNTTAEFFNEDFKIRFYPRAHLQFTIIEDVLIPYLGVNGKLQANNYLHLYRENPYIIPGTVAEPSNHKIIGYGGLKGKFSTKGSFHFKATYSMINDAVFFVNDTSTYLANQFIAVTDNVDEINLFGEINYDYSEKIRIDLKANIYRYNTFYLDEPWHKQNFDATISVHYNLRNKIMAHADIFFIGKRFALDNSPEFDRETITLDPFVDANLGLEYRYTKNLSFFLNFSNLSATRYNIWYQYPAQRLMVLGGFTYSL